MPSLWRRACLIISVLTRRTLAGRYSGQECALKFLWRYRIASSDAEVQARNMRGFVGFFSCEHRTVCGVKHVISVSRRTRVDIILIKIDMRYCVTHVPICDGTKNRGVRADSQRQPSHAKVSPDNFSGFPFRSSRASSRNI